MKLNLIRKNIASTVIISITLILLLFTFIGFIFIRDLTVSVKENKIRFEEADKSNNDYLKQIEVKGDLSRAIKDVNYTVLILNDFLKTGDTDKNSKREKIWKRITPILDTLDNHLEKSSSDFVKYNFNSIYEEINKNKIYQELAIENYKKDTLKFNESIKELARSSEKLSESYSSFLASKPEETIITFNPVSSFEDNLISKIVISAIIIGIILFIISTLVNVLAKPLSKINRYLIDLKNGDFPSDIELNLEDFNIVSKSLNHVKDKLVEIKEFAKVVSQNNYEGQTSLRFDREGELGIALIEMQENLETIALKDKERNHINQGLARFSAILSNYTNNLESFGDVVLKELVNFLKANQGAFYVASDDEMRMVSCYAYQKKKYLDLSIKKGQGLVGQVWLEAKPIYLTEVPEQYVTITSGLGASTPRSILIVPLIFNDKVQGVIELASFNLLEDYEQGFVQKVTESISAALTSVKVNTKTQILLQESSDLTNQMRLQEELMLSKVEELNLTQGETRQREISYIKEINRLKKKLEKYERNL